LLRPTLLVLALLPLRSADVPAPRDPVVFVHGFGTDARVWEPMRERFAAAGWPEEALVGWEYDWRADNRETAQRLAAEVERVLAETGAERVDLVGHSMGALPSRWYLARLGGTARVDAFVSLAAPNAGSIRGFRCDLPSCYDRRWGSPLVEALNSGDTTPGSVRYAAWWSPCDEVLVPDTTALLPGAVNTRTACLGHEALLADRQVIREVLRFVAPTGSGGTAPGGGRAAPA
jgi:triacylglycerol lipase